MTGCHSPPLRNGTCYYLIFFLGGYGGLGSSKDDESLQFGRITTSTRLLVDGQDPGRWVREGIRPSVTRA